MLDIKFIRENPKIVSEKSKQKGYPSDIQKLLNVDEERRKLIEEVDKLRSERKVIAEKRQDKKGQGLKSRLKEKEDKLEKLNEDFYKLIRSVPNIPKEDVPVGKDESQNEIVKTWGKKPDFGFKVKDHLELGVANDLIDIERAAKVSGSRFAYLKNEAVLLEFALIKYAFDNLTAEGFIPIIPPVIVNQNVIEGLGYPEYLSGEGYKLDDQYLVGTAEHSIVAMHMDETFKDSALPIRYAGFSTSFRREAGSYGKDTRGIFRVHQFDKVEMVEFVKPEQEKLEMEKLLKIAESLIQALELPYRLVKLASGDLPFPTAKTIDIETWIPFQNDYKETHSISTTTDFQARGFNIKYLPAGRQVKAGQNKKFVHILNGTAFAIGRTLIAILENYQQKDGSIEIPKVLQKYTGFAKIPSEKIG